MLPFKVKLVVAIPIALVIKIITIKNGQFIVESPATKHKISSGLSTMNWPFFIVMILITRAIGIATTSFTLNGSIIPYTTWWGLLIWACIGVAVILLFIFLYKKGDKIERCFLDKFDNLRKKNKGKKLVGDVEVDAKGEIVSDIKEDTKD